MAPDPHVSGSAKASSVPGDAAGPVGGWEPLRNRTFRMLWLASVASGIGSTMHDTAATWSMAHLTESPTLITLMQAAASLPLFLLGLPAGALADILDRRRLLVMANAAGMGFALLLGITAWLGNLSPAWLLAIAFLLGVAGAVGQPAWQALLPEIIERRQLPASVALNSIGVNVARTLGPAAGGILVAAAGPAWVFLLNGLSFIAILAVLIAWKRPATASTSQAEHVVGALAAALRYASHAPPLRRVLLRTAAYIVAAIAPVVLLPLLVRSSPDLEATDYGILLGAYGAGAVLCATILLPRLRARCSVDGILTGATAVSALCCVLLAWVPGRIGMAAVLFCAGAAWLTSMTSFSTAVQMAVPNWVRARASAMLLITMQGGIALGAVTWGQVTAHGGLRLALALAGACLVVGLVLIRWSPLNDVADLDLRPSDHWAEHHLAAEPQADDGPVWITVEYRVRPEDAEAFRNAMGPMREIRMRDGAYRWDLVRSLDDPWVFQECFLVATWAEHLRQHRRAVTSDRELEEAAQRFHQGDGDPVVRHYLVGRAALEWPPGQKGSGSPV